MTPISSVSAVAPAAVGAPLAAAPSCALSVPGEAAPPSSIVSLSAAGRGLALADPATCGQGTLAVPAPASAQALDLGVALYLFWMLFAQHAVADAYR